MAKPEKNLSLNLVSVQTEYPKSGGPEGQEAGEEAQGSNALSQYWDYENWLRGKDMRIFAPQAIAQKFWVLCSSPQWLWCAKGFGKNPVDI